VCLPGHAKSRVKRFTHNVCPWAAQGIEAEIPQARRRRAEELERKAWFFYPPGFALQILEGKKMRPNSSSEKFLIVNPAQEELSSLFLCVLPERAYSLHGA
jgi:hypothetical protein